MLYKNQLKRHVILLQEGQDKEINMKNDDKKGISFRAIYTFAMLQATSTDQQGEM